MSNILCPASEKTTTIALTRRWRFSFPPSSVSVSTHPKNNLLKSITINIKSPFSSFSTLFISSLSGSTSLLPLQATGWNDTVFLAR